MVFDHVEFDDHELVTFVTEPSSGLRAVFALHRNLGLSAGGGIRFKPYPKVEDAVTDVLRLSRAMTYKMVLAGLPLGGAKSVIIGDPATDKSPELLRAFGRFIESLDGRYSAGPDVGTDAEDMELIGRETAHVAGRSSRSGSTAPPTAEGVFNAMEATAEVVFGRQDLAGLRVAVQGAGGVGSELVARLSQAGAKVLVSDVDRARVEAVAAEWGAEVIEVDQVLSAEVDIVSPNAVGGILNEASIPTIRAAAVCGSANNQLGRPEHGELLAQRGIAWVPDYVASVGGAISGVCDLGAITEFDREAKLAAIATTTREILTEAHLSGRSTEEIANGRAAALIKA